MKTRKVSSSVFIINLLFLGSVLAKPKDETMIDFAIPISDNLVSALAEHAGTDRRKFSRVLEEIGVIFHSGSEVELDREGKRILGKLTHPEAMLIVKFSDSFSNSTVEEILDYLTGGSLPPHPNGAEQNAAGQPAPRLDSR